MDYEGFNMRMYNNTTEFEEKFPKTFVKSVTESYLKRTHSIGIDKVTKMCKKKHITYSQYQQMESLYLSKLQRL